MFSAVSARRRAERWGVLVCAIPIHARSRSVDRTRCRKPAANRTNEVVLGAEGPTRTLLHRHRQVNDARPGLSALVVHSSFEPSRTGLKQTYSCV